MLRKPPSFTKTTSVSNFSFLFSIFHFLFSFLLINLPDNNSSVESLNMKEWQDGLRALLPNININFGGLPNATSPSNANHSVPTSNTATTDSLNWDSPGSWMDPAIITGNNFSFNSTDNYQLGIWHKLTPFLKKQLYAVVSSSFHPA